MRKNAKILILLFVILLYSNCGFCADYFHLGQVAFKKQNYASAEYYFKIAVNKHPDNVNYRYYYSQALMRLNKYDEAQKQYNIIINKDPDSEAARLSVIGTKYIQSYYITSTYSASYSSYENDDVSSLYKDNYIKNAVMSDGTLIKWAKSSMPIRVYVQTNNLPANKSTYAQSVQDAFKAWQSASGNLFSFVFVNNVQKANIITSFVGQIEEHGSMKGFTSGETKPFYKGNSMVLAKVTLSIQAPNQKLLTQNVIYNTALHEIGHALGIWGHSEVDGDIMKPVSNVNSSVERSSLSTRDINTIKIIYSGSAKQVDNVLGNQKQRTLAKLKESQLYVKKVPNSPVSWTQLGNDYLGLGEYDNAIANFKKALSVNASYYQAEEQLAKAYYAKGDKVTAFLQYQDLVQKNPTNVNYSCNLAKLYLKNNQTQMAKNVALKLMTSNPKATENADFKVLADSLFKAH